MKALIINTRKASFENKDTGEVVDYCLTTLGHLEEDSNNFSGYIIEEVTGKSSDFEVIKKFTNKIADIDLQYKKVDKKNYRAKIKQIGDIEL